MSKFRILFFAIIVCGMNQGAHAALMTLDSDTDGIVKESVTCIPFGCLFQSYASTNPLATIGYSFDLDISSGRPASSGRRDMGYTVFDLSALSETALSAKLEVDLRYASDATSLLNVGAVDSATAIALAANPVGTQSAELSIFDPGSSPPLFFELFNQYLALTAGTQVGMLEQEGPFSGVFEIELSSIALDAINAADGLFALALNWNSDREGSVFSRADGIAFNSAPRLILNTAGAQVPTPATLWLVCAALALLYFRGQYT